MKSRHRSIVVRAVVTALLLLVVSPVTAPFLTFDLGALLGETAPHGAAVVQSKKAQDEPVPAAVYGPALPLVGRVLGAPTPTPHIAVRGSAPAFVPLRL